MLVVLYASKLVGIGKDGVDLTDDNLRVYVNYVIGVIGTGIGGMFLITSTFLIYLLLDVWRRGGLRGGRF